MGPLILESQYTLFRTVMEMKMRNTGKQRYCLYNA